MVPHEFSRPICSAMVTIGHNHHTVRWSRGLVQQGVRPADTGLLVPPSDPEALAAALLDLEQNPEFARSCGARGRVRIQTHFEWRTTLEQMARILRGAARLPRTTSSAPAVA